MTSQVNDAHHLFVSLTGEAIGIVVLAVFADMSDEAGKAIVAIMAGWFLLFLMVQAQFLQGIIKKV